MEIRKIAASAIIYLLIITQATAFGALLPTAATAQPKPKKALRPILECVEHLGGTSYVARFGYQNDNPQSVTISVGSNNKFTPSPIDRGQPTTFAPGRQMNVFQVPFDGTAIAWSVKGPDGQERAATASTSSQSCNSTPTPTPTPTETPSPTPSPSPGVCAPGTFEFGGGQQTSGAPNVRMDNKNGISVRTRAFSRNRSGIDPTTPFTQSFVTRQKFGYGVTNPGEGNGGGDLAKVDNTGDQGIPQVDYLALYTSTRVVFDWALLEKIGADSDARIWIADVATEPTSINQAFLDSLHSEFLIDGGGPQRTIDFNSGKLVGNLLIIAPSPSGVNDSFFLKSLSFTCPPTPNVPPVASDDAATVAEDSMNNIINVLANDTDSDGGTLTITGATNGSNGTVVNNGTNLSYTPNPNFFGTDTFTYTISDGQGGTDSATVTVTVTDVAEPTPTPTPTPTPNVDPDAVDDAATVDEDSTNNVIDVLANDTDSDGGTLTIAGATNGSNGTVVNNGTNLAYTPNANFSGTDTFTYTISDGQGGSDTATVTVTVTDLAEPAGFLRINEVEADPGDQQNDTCQYIEVLGQNPGGVVPANTWVLAVDSDSATPGFINAAINIGGQTVGANGTITLVNNFGNFTCPNRTYPAGTNVVFYQSPLRIGGGNLAVGSESFIILESTANIFAGLDADSNDDGELDFTATYIDAAAFLVNPDEQFAYPSNTAVLGVPFTDVPDALVRFEGNTNAFDASAFFWAEVAATSSETTDLVEPRSANFPQCATLTPGAPNTVVPGCVVPTPTPTATPTPNAAPDAVDDAATVAEDTAGNVINVLANDTDPEGQTLTVLSVTQPANGVAVNNGVNVSYTPAPNFFGTDTFTYTISDGFGGQDTATVTVTVSNVNDAPVANDDATTVVEDSTGNAVNVLANDTDADAGQTLTVSSVTQGANGTVVNNGTGVSYSPNSNFSGSDSFTYTISDGNGGSDTATVAVTVTAVNDGPLAGDDAYQTDEDTVLNVGAPGVLSNDGDPEGDALSAVLVTTTSNGTLTLNGNGSFSYTPNANFNGSDSFTYEANDGGVDSNTATVIITVNSVNDGPDAVNDSATVDQGSSGNIVNVLANDSDPDGGTLSVTGVTQGTNGAVANGSTSVSYTPNAGFSGSDSFTYTISDGQGGSDTATVTVTVSPVAGPAGQLLINEVIADPGDQTNDSCQYIEIKGANPGGTVPANTWVVVADADSANPGVLHVAVNIGGQAVGSNGTITLVNSGAATGTLPCPNRSYPAGTNLIQYFSTFRIGGGLNEVGSESFLILETTAPLAVGQDRDADDDGNFDFTVTNYVDYVSFVVNPDEQVWYPGFQSPILGNPFGDVPDAFTRFSNNNNPFDGSAFFWGEVSTPAESTTYQAPLSVNFPAGGQLTPGSPNLP